MGATAFEGELSFFSLPELIQLVCSSGHDAEISITRREDGGDPEPRGRVIVRGGRVFRCSCGAASGEAAFFELARLRQGRFSVNPLPSEGTDQASLMRYSWQELLLETARREDEAKRDADAKAGTPAPTQRAPRPSDGYIDLFTSSLPPPAPAPPARGDAYERAAERGQLIPFPRKGISEPTASPAAVMQPLPAEATPPPSSVAPLSQMGPARPAGSPLDKLIQEATAAYLRREYDRALELFERCRELAPNDRRVEHNIDRIKNRRSRS